MHVELTLKLVVDQPTDRQTDHKTLSFRAPIAAKNTHCFPVHVHLYSILSLLVHTLCLALLYFCTDEMWISL